MEQAVEFHPQVFACLRKVNEMRARHRPFSGVAAVLLWAKKNMMLCIICNFTLAETGDAQ
jgi:hypothetical protein